MSPAPVTVLRTYARVWSSDLDASLATFGPEDFRFGFGDVTIALAGGIQITAGPAEALAPFTGVTATLVVADLDAVLADAGARGETITFGPTDGPVARYAMVRGRDGTHVEYAQWTEPRLLRLLPSGQRPSSVEPPGDGPETGLA